MWTADPVVDGEWLAARLGRKDVLPADCRFYLADPEAGWNAYVEAHIPGAVYFDLDKHLSRPGRGAGGRHPLPPMEQFVALLAARGVDEDVTVVCYDDSGGSIAARLWWMLRFVGHKKALLLDGGFPVWTAAGLPVAAGKGRAGRDDVPAPAAAAASPPEAIAGRVRTDMAVSAAEVRRLAAAGRGVIVDSRAPERYRGEVEPLDPVPGHIPGAVNFPWEGNVDGGGRLLSAESLAERFAPLRRKADAGEPIVVHCGSGVTGCLNILAMERAGIKGAKLYVGGWSDWCSDPANPVAVGDGPEAG